MQTCLHVLWGVVGWVVQAVTAKAVVEYVTDVVRLLIFYWAIAADAVLLKVSEGVNG